VDITKELRLLPGETTVQKDETWSEYAGMLSRYRWLIGGLAIAGAIAAAAWAYSQEPMYQSKATVVVQEEGPEALQHDRARRPDVSPEYFQTHFELMKSHYVLQQTAARLKLSEQGEYRAETGGFSTWLDQYRSETDGLITWLADTVTPLRSLLRGDGETTASASLTNELLQRRFSQQVEIMPIRGARLAHIIVNSEDPQFAALAANTLVSVYIERVQALELEAKEKAAAWFGSHLNDLRKKVEDSQQALYVFRQKHGLLQAQERQAVTAHSLSELNSELVRAEMRKAETQVRLRQLQSVLSDDTEMQTVNWDKLDASTEVLTSLLIQGLRTQEIKLTGEMAELSDKYGPLHPKIARVQAELHDLRAQIQQEVRKVYQSAKQEFDTAVVREKTIKEAVDRHKHQKIGLEQYDIEHGILAREAESSQHMYDLFLKEMKEANLSMGLRASNVYLADPAVASLIPVKPQKKLNTMLGLVIGLMTGVGLALLLNMRDRSLRGPDDVERYLPSLTLLGIVPFLPKADRMNGSVLGEPHHETFASESIRAIRTSLLLANSGRIPSCVLITSPGANEGKTTLAANLATAMAQLKDRKVLFIDADLRSAKRRTVFIVQKSYPSPAGLTNFLRGEIDACDMLYHTGNPNLFVIPRGEDCSNPLELLHSNQMRKLLSWCRDEGFHVIIDSPPILPVTDAMVLANQVDGVLLVVSAGETKMESCRQSLRRLADSGGNVLGVVIQKVRKAHLPQYGYGNAVQHL
jgi:polysaccharide biosynthesis transport protein